MDHCASSGFGIFANGKYVKFDAEGSKKAKALVEKTKKEKDIAIVAEGTLEGDTLTVASLEGKIVEGVVRQIERGSRTPGRQCWVDALQSRACLPTLKSSTSASRTPSPVCGERVANGRVRGNSPHTLEA